MSSLTPLQAEIAFTVRDPRGKGIYMYMAHMHIQLQIGVGVIHYIYLKRYFYLTKQCISIASNIRFTASAFCKLPSIYVFSYFPFGFEGRMWDLIVSVPDHCLSFYFSELLNFLIYPGGGSQIHVLR